MSRSRILIRNISFAEDGMAVEYMNVPADVRQNGLSITHSVWIPREDDYDDEIAAVEDAALEAVMDALEDFGRLPAVDLKAQVEQAIEDRASEDNELDDDEPEE